MHSELAQSEITMQGDILWEQNFVCVGEREKKMVLQGYKWDSERECERQRVCEESRQKEGTSLQQVVSNLTPDPLHPQAYSPLNIRLLGISSLIVQSRRQKRRLFSAIKNKTKSSFAAWKRKEQEKH